MKLASSFVSLLCVCALALAACGSSSSSSSGDDGLASLAPADTPFYTEFTTQPSDEQKTTLESLISRFAPSDSGSDFDQMVQDLIDQGTAQSGTDFKISYADDIQSWLGASGAFWIPEIPQDYDTQPDSVNTPAAFVVQTTDDDAAQAFIDKAIQANGGSTEKKDIDGVQAEVTPNDPGAIGIDDGYLIVASTEDAFSAAIDARNGDSLGDQDDFGSFQEPGGDTFASAYIDLKPFVENYSQIDPSELDAVEKVYPGLLETPLKAALSATSDSISVDVAAAAPPGSSGEQSGQLDDVPATAVAALGFGDIGNSISQGLDQVKAIGDATGQPGFDPDQIDQTLQAQAGFDLSDIEDTLGTGDVYVAGDFPDNYVVGIQIALKKDASALTEKLKSAIEAAPTNSGAKVGPSLTGSDGFSLQLPPQADPNSARVFDFAFEPDKATILISPNKQALTDAASSGSLTDSDGFKSASEALGSDYSPVFFTDLKSLGDAIAASGTTIDPDGQLVLDFLQKQGSYLVFGSGSDGGKVRVTLGLQSGAGN